MLTKPLLSNALPSGIQKQQPFSVSIPVSLQKFLQVIRQLFCNLDTPNCVACGPAPTPNVCKNLHIVRRDY